MSNATFARPGAASVLPYESPAFIYSTAAIVAAHKCLLSGLGSSPVRVLYSAKACSLEPVIELLNPLVTGFAVASPAETAEISRLTGGRGLIHMTTPGFQPQWAGQLSTVTHLAFNSLPQWERLNEAVPASASLGIRVNPGVSIVGDERYDPCRRFSKLGARISEVADWLTRGIAPRLRGLHVHNGCMSTSWQPLLLTVREITSGLGPFLSRMDWINLGGGYVWDETTDFAPIQEAVDLLTTRYGLEVFIEPGAGLVNAAGSMVASVIDIFRSDGKRVAVLDTTVNHLPEVFEYQYEPDVLEHADGAPYEYILAGCSCLAGDLFGEYSFEEPLVVGSRVTFLNVGAYSVVKAHRFNGISLPAVYMESETGDFASVRYDMGGDSLNRGGGQLSAALRTAD